MDMYDVTLAEIARKFGVDPQTLERYLVEELDPMKKAVLFDPRWTKLEQLLTYGSTGVLYCLVERADHAPPRPRTISDYVSKLLEGVHQASTAQGYAATYYVTHLALATPDYFLAILDRHPHAGVLMLIPQAADTLAEVCAEMGRPALIIDYLRPQAVPVHVLNVDNCGAMREMTHRLIALGHWRIAYITGLMHYHSAVERLEGYKLALEDAGIPFDPALVANGNWEMELGHDRTAALLTMDDRPTAVMCSNDLTALGAYPAIHEAGLAIPDDVSVVGFDDIPIVANIEPPLATVRQSMTDMGYSAAALLIEAMEGELAGGYEHMHPLELIVRASIGPARASSAL